MKMKFFDVKMVVIYCMILILFLIFPLLGNQAIIVIANNPAPKNNIIIDAGHGGIDSGAVSCTGVYESRINLEIALKVNDLMHLLGVRTIMIRDTDRSVHTNGSTIAAKKVSDIKERIRIANSTQNPLFISIHQNNFHDARYSGTQVFYNSESSSKEFAEMMQTNFREKMNPNNHRQIKKSSGVYLMDHMNCSGILIECGFLSNPAEEANLRDTEYQKKISAVITTTTCQYLNS